jgi:hypothetical protein
MKKILYIILFCTLFLGSCGSDNDETDDILMVTNVDLSDFRIYTGSSEGGKEVQFNDLKKTDLATRFFGTAYRNNIYDKIEIQFNDKKLTFIDSTGTTKIISDFEFQGDSLFIKKHDGGKIFVALGTYDNLYRMKGLSRYRLNNSKDSIRIFNEPLNLDKMLAVRGLSSLSQMTDPTDTLIWCNAIYIFN